VSSTIQYPGHRPLSSNQAPSSVLAAANQRGGTLGAPREACVPSGFGKYHWWHAARSRRAWLSPVGYCVPQSHRLVVDSAFFPCHSGVELSRPLSPLHLEAWRGNSYRHDRISKTLAAHAMLFHRCTRHQDTVTVPSNCSTVAEGVLSPPRADLDVAPTRNDDADGAPVDVGARAVDDLGAREAVH